MTRGGGLPPGAEGNSGRVGCAGPGDEHRTYAEAGACSAGQSRRRGGFMRGGWSAVVWCGDDMPRKGGVGGGGEARDSASPTKHESANMMSP